ncbi:zinc finger protein 644-like isoform X1 [Lates japonicus]|uniref:Zinc finger protein 644-like isoform X1 n=1 Tax=Lates japonicus TaxID=270547 RepID=A0AAD3N291_LATJO|nr:zinc finger protein 644-like isoform X1 [Lates japonicus]
MSDLKPNVQEDKEVESVSASPGRTQEPLQSHTFSLKNNAAGLSSDEHENPLNGTQPNPFVYSSVPAVPHAGNSLPSGTLVNGPGSHPTSEVHCVLNKGTVLSNNVLDAVWQVEKDTSPEVLPPPSELQSDAWKNTAGPAVKTLATQPGVNTPQSHSEENESKLAYSTLSVVEHKPCPYCPAMFESGVGLSNHVRGHLHRVGLSYNARHMVSPEQVALRDHQPRTRRRIRTGTRKMRKAVKPETQGEHTCPLCWGWFDTKTGLSNHVRGHLKRIGRSITSTSKSPLCILNELLQDKKEHRNILQVLNKSQFPPQPSVSQKFISSSGLVLMRAALPVKIQYEMRSPHPIGDRLVPKQEEHAFSESSKAQTGIKASSSTLVELLKTRGDSMELTARNDQDAYATRKLCGMTKEYREETQITSVEPNWTCGECDSDKICIQCNSNVPAAVSLSGHLQAYACRKRIAVFEEPGYDYKQKKPRPRPGLKKKILPCLNAQIYTLTCRFCDLVFRALSIQEDWIKHTGTFCTNVLTPGTGMVEVWSAIR